MSQFVQYLVAIALSFWTPYNGGVNPCPDGVTYRVWERGTWNPPPAEVPGKVVAWSYIQKGNCRINFAPSWTYLVRRPEIACMVVIHELGHSAMGLDHSKTGLMQIKVTNVRPIGACFGIPRRVLVPPFRRPGARPSSIPLGKRPRHMQEPVPIGLGGRAVG